MTIICLSPHFDDAILSCGGQLLQYRQAGTPVTIVNIVTRTTSQFYSSRPLKFKAQSLDYERKEEERQAISLLDLQSEDLALMDAPFRNPRYRSYHCLMGAIPQDEQTTINKLVNQVQDIAFQLKPTLILAPLAVGQHIDHQIVHQAGRILQKEHP